MSIVIDLSRVKLLLVALFMLMGELKPQNNPICKAKRYQCQTNPLPDQVCVQISDEQEKYYFIRSCSGDKSYCPYQNATYGSPAKCEKPGAQTIVLSLPYDTCSKDANCLSQFCDNGRCKGKLANEACKTHSDCHVDLYCNKLGVCASQLEFDQPCTEDAMCVNNCLCNNNRCAFYYTFADGSEATNPEACESGYIENGKCQTGLKTKNPGQPCSSDSDCMFIDGQGKVKKYGNCTCGFNAGSYSYCNLETGDQEFKDMTRSLRFLTATNYGCHTLRRFGPCDKLYIEEYNDYHFKLNRFKMYPLIIGNDDCTARVYTWDYWKFFLHGNLPAYLGPIIFFHAFYMLIN